MIGKLRAGSFQTLESRGAILRGAPLAGLNPAHNGAMLNHTVPDPQSKKPVLPV